jgi:hypothetical protein
MTMTRVSVIFGVMAIFVFGGVMAIFILGGVMTMAAGMTVTGMARMTRIRCSFSGLLHVCVRHSGLDWRVERVVGRSVKLRSSEESSSSSTRR